MTAKCEKCGHSGNANGSKFMPILMMVLVGGGAIGVSQGGDSLLNQALDFINQDIGSLRDDIKSIRYEFAKSEEKLDTKLQLEQRLLINTIETEIEDLDRLLHVEINQGIKDIYKLMDKLKDLEDRIRFMEVTMGR